jgi:phytol kinase
MAAAFQIAIAIGSILILLGLMMVVRKQATQWGLGAEVQRKLVHIGTGLYALCLPWLFTDRWPVFMLVGLTLIVMLTLRMPRFAKGGIGETLHGVERQSYGDILLALAVGMLFLLSDGRAILYVLPLAILTLADAAAALTGSTYGKRHFSVEDGRKSIEGSVAFFMISLVLSMVCLLLLSDVARPNVILLALIIAAFGTLVEADSWRGFDNFFLPAGILVFLAMHMDNTPMELAFITLLFALSTWAVLGVAPRLQLSAQTARVYVVTAFMLLSVTVPQNTVLPLSVLGMHLLACRTNPCTSRYPHLDAVAMIALASFGWLCLGLLFEINALWFYGLHMAALTLGLAVLSSHPLPPLLRWLAVICTALVLWVIYTVLMRFNLEGTDWAGPMLVPFLLGAVLMSALPLWRNDGFKDRRMAKLALLSALVPMTTYSWRAAQMKGWM